MPNNYALEPNQSRSEDIIQSILDEVSYNEEAQSRIEYLLIQLKNVIEQGGGGGVTSYDGLTGHPKIDNHELVSGNNSSSDLGLQTKIDSNNKLSADLITNGATNITPTVADKATWDAKANVSDIPTSLSDLTDDTMHRTVTDTEKATWNGKQDALSTAQKSALSSGITSSLLQSLVNRTGKNRLRLSKTAIKAANTLGTWSDNVYTRTDEGNNITITMYDDMTFKISGYAATSVTLMLQTLSNSDSKYDYFGYDYYLSAAQRPPVNPSTGLVSVIIQQRQSPYQNYAQAYTSGDRVPISYYSNAAVFIEISAGFNGAVTVYPMICSKVDYSYNQWFIAPYILD